MARPTAIKVGMNGEVIMKNLTKEQQLAIASALRQLEEVKEPEHQVAEAAEQMVDVSVLPYTAIGVNKNNAGLYELVTVKYNSSTKQAVVESVKEIKDRPVAIGEFRLLVVELGIY